jgi:HK97 family phage portal protein
MAVLPELRSALKNFISGFETSPISLELRGWQDFSFDASNVGELYRRDGFNGLAAMLDGGAGPAWSGENVSRQSILSLSVAWAAHRMMSEMPSLLPFEIYQKVGPSSIKKRDDLPIYEVFHDGNDEHSSMDLRATWMSHLLLDGNCFGQNIRRSGTGVALDCRMLLPSQVLPEREKLKKSMSYRRIQYTVSQAGQSNKVYFVNPGEPQDIFHCRGISQDGLVGYSVIKVLQQPFGNSLGAAKTQGKFFFQGARRPYVLKTGKKYSKEDFDRYRQDWEQIYSQPNRAAILEMGMEYQPIGDTMAEAQMLEFMQFSVFDICRAFGINPVMVGDLSKSSYSTVEAVAQQFVKFSLHPWLERLEKTFRRCVLTPAERRQGIYARHNANGISRGDFLTRVQGYASMIQNGILSINEAREREDMPPIEGGDEHRQQMQMTSATAAPTTPPQKPSDIDLEEDLEDDET